MKGLKMISFKHLACIAAMLTIMANYVYAGGIYLTELGTPISVGTAGVGSVTNTNGADSVFTNPAGMTGIKGDQFIAGSQAVLPTIRFDPDSGSTAGGDDGGNAGSATVIPSAFYVKDLGNDWRIGISMTAQLGGGVDYGGDFVGRYSAQKSVLSGYGISPAVAYRVNNKLSVGAGLSSVYTDLDLDIAINQPGPMANDGVAKFDELTDWSYQGYLGLTYQASDRLTIGAVYRSEADADLEGDLHFFNVPPGTMTGDGAIDYTYPQVIQVGVKYQLTHDTILMADLDWEEWSEFGATRVEINNNAVGTFDRNWDDTWHIGFAVMHRLSEGQAISAGIAYDSSPVDDQYRTADLPVDEQVRLSAGYFHEISENMSYGLGGTFLWLGEGKMDQTVQGERYVGEFSTNHIIFLSATLKYEF
jgi:long-chain fatty acid transport protein